jgi:rhodanese-related sulfurtransferase
MSSVSEIAAAPADVVIEHFERRLSLETDCADVGQALAAGQRDFILLHVIGSSEAYRRRHVPGALHLPHREIDEERMAQWPQETLFVAYCAGPHCNGADRAALKLARLGRRVKIMLGGITGWEDEGFAFAMGTEPGDLRNLA